MFQTRLTIFPNINTIKNLRSFTDIILFVIGEEFSPPTPVALVHFLGLWQLGLTKLSDFLKEFLYVDITNSGMHKSQVFIVMFVNVI